MKKKPSYNIRRCRIRINIQKFENMLITNPDWGFGVFTHNLN